MIPPAPPTIVPDPVPTGPENSNLERFAVITASSKRNDEYHPSNVADGVKSTTGTAIRGYVWLPEAPAKDDSISLTWNSQVIIKEVRLFDNPQTKHQVTSGTIIFENSADDSLSFDPADFGDLPDDAATPASIAGPTDPVTSIEVRILDDNGGSNIGFSEIVVVGYRVDEAIEEMNVARHGFVPTDEMGDFDENGYSSVKGFIYTDTDTGPNRTTKINDGKISAGSEWVSDGNGKNTYIELVFDREYTVTSITLHDRKDGTARFTHATVRFPDADTEVEATKSATDGKVIIDLESPVRVDDLRIELDEIDPTGDSFIGLAEVEITATYSPAE